MTTAIELAWAAGLFEGEGTICVGTHSSNGRKFVRIALSSTDEDVIRRFVSAIGCGRVGGPYNQSAAGTKPIWRWHPHGVDAERALKSLEPFLCIRRREQLAAAQLVVDAQPPPGVWITKGARHTDAARAKMSESAKASWARRKAAVR